MGGFNLRIIASCWYSVLVNGQTNGFFPLNRGLRQGDPLSQALFIIAVECSSRSLKSLHEKYDQLQSNGGLIISHLGYADDVIIVCNGSTFSLKKHMPLI